MDWTTFFVTAVLPYVALIVLIDGMLYRLYRWVRRPKAKMQFTIYPGSRGFGRALLRVLRDVLVYPRLLREEKALWAGALLFHLSLIMVVMSHYKAFFRYIWFWEGLKTDPNTFQLVSKYFDGATGAIMIIALLFLFGRRFPRFLRKLSDPEDYFAILLVLTIAVSGIYIRFISSTNLLELRGYFLSLAALSPSYLPTDPAFLMHYLLTLILMIYFPLGKMVHSMGMGLTSLLITLERK
jgi:nitrate reductase gamma subunit